MHTTFSLRLRVGLAAVLAFSAFGQAQAFSDDEARRAILDLRQRFDAQRQMTENQANSILALSSQIQELSSEIAVLRGRIEELERTTQTQTQSTQPREVALDGKTFTAQPQEVSDYEAALDKLRQADYTGAVTLFKGFAVRWPQSGYLDSVYFWLGNAQYGTKQYAEAIKSFETLTSRSAEHIRVPDALLAIANCQVELKNTRAARAALEKLVQNYPQTDAANEARQRLAQIR